MEKMNFVCKDVTHAFFTSYAHNSDLSKLPERNNPLFRNFLEAIDVACPKLQRMCLQTGGKVFYSLYQIRGWCLTCSSTMEFNSRTSTCLAMRIAHDTMVREAKRSSITNRRTISSKSRNVTAPGTTTSQHHSTFRHYRIRPTM